VLVAPRLPAFGGLRGQRATYRTSWSERTSCVARSTWPRSVHRRGASTVRLTGLRPGSPARFCH